MAGRRQTKEREAEARKAAAEALPGWEVAPDLPTPSGSAESDFVGADSDALKAKYLGAAPDGGAPPPDDDVQLVDMKPKGESAVRSRKVVVSGGKVSGFQG